MVFVATVIKALIASKTPVGMTGGSWIGIMPSTIDYMKNRYNFKSLQKLNLKSKFLRNSAIIRIKNVS